MNRYLPVFISALIWFVVLGAVVYAAEFDPGDSPWAEKLGINSETASLIKNLSLGTQQPIYAALNLMNLALSLLGALSLALLTYAGLIWIWARGNADEVKKAKNIIEGAVIGLIIVLAALGITRFVFTQVGDITGAQVQTQSTTTQ